MEDKIEGIVLALEVSKGGLRVRSSLPKLVQVGFLLSAADQLLAKLLVSMTDEEVKSLDNKKIQQN
jgi:hypothetical protein